MVSRRVTCWAGALLLLLSFLPAVGVAAPEDRATLLIELPEKPMAPPLVLADLDGTRHDIADYRGKVVVVNFWATWCAPCRKEFPALERAWKKLEPAGVVLLAASLGDRREAVERFLMRFPVTFPVLVEGGPALGQSWQLQGMPTTYVIDRSGRIHFGAIGERAWDDEMLLARILALTQ